MRYLIPLTSSPFQSQNFNHLGFSLTLVTKWNSVCELWSIDLYDNDKQQWLTMSEALAINSLACSSLDMPFGFIPLDDSENENKEATLENMGSYVNLYIISKANYHEAIQASI